MFSNFPIADGHLMNSKLLAFGLWNFDSELTQAFLSYGLKGLLCQDSAELRVGPYSNLLVTINQCVANVHTILQNCDRTFFHGQSAENLWSIGH